MLVEFGLQIYPNETLASQSKGDMTRPPVTWYIGTASGNGSGCPGPANASPTIPPGWQPGDRIVYVDEHHWLRSLAWYALGIGLSVLVAWLCFGCADQQQSSQPQSSTVSSNLWNGIVRDVLDAYGHTNEGPLLNKVEAPAFPAEPALVVQRQPMGYETITNGCAWVNLTNGPNAGLVVGPFCEHPKTNIVFTWNCSPWWKPYHTGLININDGTTVCYMVAQATNSFSTVNSNSLLARAFSTP